MNMMTEKRYPPNSFSVVLQLLISALLIFQVHMRVDQAGHHGPVLQVDHLVARTRAA